MPNEPVFLVRPIFRCCEPVENSPRRRCARPAPWSSPADTPRHITFRCDDHKRENDRPVELDALFRRVSITAEILYSGISMDQTAAIAEALATLELAVEQSGGLLNLHTTHSAIGRWKATAPLRSSIAASGDRT